MLLQHGQLQRDTNKRDTVKLSDTARDIDSLCNTTGTTATPTITAPCGKSVVPVYDSSDQQFDHSQTRNTAVSVITDNCYEERRESRTETDQVSDTDTDGQFSRLTRQHTRSIDDLKRRVDDKCGVVRQNLKDITVRSVSDIFKILQRGIKQRQTAATLRNKNSGEEVVRHGQLNLLDRAG